MKTLKAGLAVVGLVIGMNARAQDGERKTPEEKAAFRSEKLAEELSLTTEQQLKVTEIHIRALQQKQEVLNDSTLSKEDRHAKLKDTREAFHTEIKTVLTTEQLAKLEAKKEEHLDRTPEKKAKQQTQRLTKELSLSEEQQVRVTEINLQATKKAEAVRNNVNLTEDEQKTALQEIHRSQKAELKVILTPEQLNKLKESKENREEKREKRMCNKPQQPAAPEK